MIVIDVMISHDYWGDKRRIFACVDVTYCDVDSARVFSVWYCEWICHYACRSREVLLIEWECQYYNTSVLIWITNTMPIWLAQSLRSPQSLSSGRMEEWWLFYLDDVDVSLFLFLFLFLTFSLSICLTLRMSVSNGICRYPSNDASQYHRNRTDNCIGTSGTTLHSERSSTSGVTGAGRECLTMRCRCWRYRNWYCRVCQRRNLMCTKSSDNIIW